LIRILKSVTIENVYLNDLNEFMINKIKNVLGESYVGFYNHFGKKFYNNLEVVILLNNLLYVIFSRIITWVLFVSTSH